MVEGLTGFLRVQSSAVLMASAPIVISHFLATTLEREREHINKPIRKFVYSGPESGRLVITTYLVSALLFKDQPAAVRVMPIRSNLINSIRCCF